MKTGLLKCLKCKIVISDEIIEADWENNTYLIKCPVCGNKETGQGYKKFGEYEESFNEIKL